MSLATPSPTRRVPASPACAAEDWPAPYWLVDASFMVMLLLLAATDEGLGALFFRLHRDPGDLLAALGVPAGKEAIGAVALGYEARPAGGEAGLPEGRALIGDAAPRQTPHGGGRPPGPLVAAAPGRACGGSGRPAEDRVGLRRIGSACGGSGRPAEDRVGLRRIVNFCFKLASEKVTARNRTWRQVWDFFECPRPPASPPAGPARRPPRPRAPPAGLPARGPRPPAPARRPEPAASR